MSGRYRVMIVVAINEYDSIEEVVGDVRHMEGITRFTWFRKSFSNEARKFLM